MGLGTGHVQDMNNRLKFNRSQRASQKPRFKSNQREAINSEQKSLPEKPTFKEIPPSELIKLKFTLRKKLQQRNRTYDLRFKVFVGVSFLVFLTILFYLLNF